MCRLIWTQVHARDQNQVRQGVKAADSLLKLKAEETQQLQYLAAVGEFKLGKYTDARARVRKVLEENPQFGQGKSLLKLIEDKMMQDTAVAGGVIAGVGVVSAAVLGVMLSGSKKN